MHALDVAKVVDGREDHVGFSFEAGSRHKVAERGTSLGQFSASNGLRCGLDGGFASHPQAIQDRGPNALFLQFSNAFFHVVGGPGDLDFDVSCENTNNGFGHVSNVFACIVKHWRSPVDLEVDQTARSGHASMR